MIKRIIIFCIISFKLFGCKENIINNKGYDKSISYFEGIKEGITSHFPKEIEFGSSYFYTIDSLGYYNTQEINITITKAEKEIENLKKLYKKEQVYTIDNNCIIVVNDFIKKDDIPFMPDEEVLLSESNDKIYMTTYSNKCTKSYKVIPNFWNNFYGIDRAAKNGLNQSFKYIILAQEGGEGVYSPKLNSKISFMPSFAKHGYSKGIAYSDKDKIVIYWLIFW